MSITVQRRRGSKVNHLTFTGADGELTIDTTNYCAVVHDGVTPGGHPQVCEDTFLEANRYSSVILPPAHFNGSQANNRTLGDLSLKFVYMGRCPRLLMNEPVTARMRITTAYVAGTSGVRWAEMVLATGPIVPGGSPTLTFLEFVDVATVINATGIQQIVFPNVTIDPETDWWVGIGNSIGTGGAPAAAALRSFSVGDDLAVGIQGTIANTRPSESIGDVFPLVVDASSINAIWVALII